MKTTATSFITLFLPSFVANALKNYSVGCPDGTQASVRVRFKSKVANPRPGILEICAFPVNGDALCRSTWTVYKSAEKSYPQFHQFNAIPRR